MALSYWDFLSPTDVQSAMTNTFQQQVAGHRAVAPAVNLAGPIKDALARHEQANQLALGQERLGLGARQTDLAAQRLALTRNQYQYEQGQMPWATGIGILGAATNIYGGLQRLQGADQARVQAGQQRDIYDRIMAESSISTKRMLQRTQELTDLYRTPPAGFTAANPAVPAAPL
jgi:hypothetical protein